MDVAVENSVVDKGPTDFGAMIATLVDNEKVIFKSQQRNEGEMTKEEKTRIATELFDKSKSAFLARFGRFLSGDDLLRFREFENDGVDDVSLLITTYSRMQASSTKCLKNRRYAALKKLIESNSYFSETEMMKRNPLLYEQLIGQYLTEDEKRARDNSQVNEKSFVAILMEGIERDQAELKRKKQEEEEDDEEESVSNPRLVEMQTDSSDEDIPNEGRTLWGEYKEKTPRKKRKSDEFDPTVTVQERKLLRNEFVSTMYQSFLDGKDADFDYETVDKNEEYDNLEIETRDEEEKYFDSEEPEEDPVTVGKEDESSEDELDIYMSALNNHPAVCQLSKDMQKL